MITIKKIGVLPLLMSAIAVYGMNFDAENEAEWESTIEKGSQAATYYSYGVHGSQQIDKKDLKAFEYYCEAQAIEAVKERVREEPRSKFANCVLRAWGEQQFYEIWESGEGTDSAEEDICSPDQEPQNNWQRPELSEVVRDEGCERGNFEDQEGDQRASHMQPDPEVIDLQQLEPLPSNYDLGFYEAENPFVCHQCNQRFSAESKLTGHMRTHTYEAENPFVCQQCKKRFPAESKLAVHMQTHTGEKPFECDICKKRFSQRGNLTRHKEAMHEEKP